MFQSHVHFLFLFVYWNCKLLLSRCPPDLLSSSTSLKIFQSWMINCSQGIDSRVFPSYLKMCIIKVYLQLRSFVKRDHAEDIKILSLRSQTSGRLFILAPFGSHNPFWSSRLFIGSLDPCLIAFFVIVVFHHLFGMFASHLSHMLVLLMIAKDMPPGFSLCQLVDLLQNQRW